uniref:Endolysin n=1 Tax=Myoviridae sp. ctKZW4 TaxID=2826639 RepID=A0A8S5NCB6_9CAUD|nr:MAG TPA: lysozyme [Myoviridae sp. ctKZW4]
MNKTVKKTLAGAVCLVSVIVGKVYTDHADGLVISKQGAQLAGNEEGCRRVPYRCSAHVLSFGIGAAVTGGTMILENKRYTDDEIAEQYAKDLKKAGDCIMLYFNGAEMNQNQIDALGSVVHNLGCGGARYYYDKKSGKRLKTQLYKAALDKDFVRMCNTFTNYANVNGKPLPSLLKRRLRERDLCLTPVSN